MYSILLIDDEEYILKAFTRVFRFEPYHLTLVTDPLQALEICEKQKFDMVITDQRMPGLKGMELLRKIKGIQDTLRVIISGFADFKDVVSGFNDGTVHKFLAKPWDNQKLKTEIAEVLGNANQHRHQALAEESEESAKSINFHGIFTESPVLIKQIEFVRQVAGSGTGAPYFIGGETGTGKEMFARSIHLESRRKNEPFIAVNCANLSEELLESQLFGHKKGAFTGAHADKKGLFEEADGGTVFLDEIVELPLSLQAKLLRVLQEREFTRLGDNLPIKFDVQIISASALSLKDAVEQGCFRADLRYRLDVMRVTLPPLKERSEDVLLLFRLFLHRHLQAANITELEVDDEIVRLMTEYQWPGNVRELENACVYMAALLPANNGVLCRSCLPPELSEVLAAQSELESITENIGSTMLCKASVEKVLQEHNGNKSAAARYLGISRMTLWRKLKE